MTKIAASLPDELVLPARAAPEKGRFASVPAQYVLGPGEPERAVWRRVIVAVLRTTDSLAKRRVAICDERGGIGGDAQCPASDSDDVVEQAARIPAGESGWG